MASRNNFLSWKQLWEMAKVQVKNFCQQCTYQVTQDCCYSVQEFERNTDTLKLEATLRDASNDHEYPFNYTRISGPSSARTSCAYSSRILKLGFYWSASTEQSSHYCPKKGISMKLRTREWYRSCVMIPKS